MEEIIAYCVCMERESVDPVCPSCENSTGDVHAGVTALSQLRKSQVSNPTKRSGPITTEVLN